MKNSINLLVGKKDVFFLNTSGGNYSELPHPFISSINSKEPIIPEINAPNDFIIIGKLKGLPVAFRDLNKPIKNFLLPLLENQNKTLYIFESCGLKICKETNKYSNIKVISKTDKLPQDFFKSKVLLNMGICGGGTANRSLSALFDGAYLFSTNFGVRNIDKILFKGRIIISRHSPFQKNFYYELMNSKFTSKNINKNKIINQVNDDSEKLLINYLK